MSLFPPEDNNPRTPTDPETAKPPADRAEDRVSFVPHTPSGAVDDAPQRFRTARYGDLDIREMVRILDTIEDERARARFRESIYISVFIWAAIVALLFLGPKYLWHPAQVRVIPSSAHEKMISLNAPSLPHIAPSRPPVVDQKTLQHLRDTERVPTPRPQPPAPQPQPTPATAQPTPQPTPAPPQPAPAPTRTPTPLPSAPQPTHTAAPSSVPDAPAPQASSGPFAAPRHPATTGGVGGPRVAPPSKGIAGGGGIGAGAQILSDTQGVDFTEWLRRFQRQTQSVWEPMLPEEIYPPLSKRGTTVLDITIGPDGTIQHMKLADSTHDVALDKAAWGSIVSQDKLQPLPSAFHGPNIVLRCYFVVSDR